MTDKELKELVASLAISQAKTDEQMKKTDKQIEKTSKEIQELKVSQAKTDETLKRVTKLVGNISNNQGDIAEEFFYNTLASKQKLAGINYDFINKNAHKRVGKIEDEYDILMVNGKDIAIIETKYKAHIKDVEKLINRKYENFKKLYPEYKDYNHHLGLASFYINEDVKDMALDNNVMLLQRKGDIIETIMPTNKN